MAVHCIARLASYYRAGAGSVMLAVHCDVMASYPFCQCAVYTEVLRLKFEYQRSVCFSWCISMVNAYQ